MNNTDRNFESLRVFLEGHAESNSVSFHMPGHKGSRFYRNLGYGDLIEKLVDMDITEIPGADNLFQPESVIRRIMDRYKALYETEETFLSVGGSSAGLIAAILATVGEGDSVIMARNSHKSIYNGVRLACGEPIYVYPEIVEASNVAGEISLEALDKALKEWESKEGNSSEWGANDNFGPVVILPSPNYYGICSDIKSIAEMVHERDGILIVDQAHGAHLKFMAEVPAAEDCGADIVINSVHKTLCSFTQTAIVNLCSERVQKELLEDRLQMIQTSSPSYMLMLSLDICSEILEQRGLSLFAEWKENVDWFYREASQIGDIEILSHPMQDRTKIVFKKNGMSGYELESRLAERGLVMELADSEWVISMTGIGNTRDDYEKLLEALRP